MIFKRPTTNAVALNRVDDGIQEISTARIAKQIAEQLLSSFGAETTQAKAHFAFDAATISDSTTNSFFLRVVVPADLIFRKISLTHNGGAFPFGAAIRLIIRARLGSATVFETQNLANFPSRPLGDSGPGQTRVNVYPFSALSGAGGINPSIDTFETVIAGTQAHGCGVIKVALTCDIIELEISLPNLGNVIVLSVMSQSSAW